MSNSPPEERPRPKPLSEHPSVEAEQLRAQALLDAYGAGSAAARQRFAAHHPRFARDTGTATARDVRLVIAREYGFANWQQLTVHIAAARLAPEQRTAAFLNASWAWGDWELTQALLTREPALATANLYTACVLGAADAVAEHLRRQPELARRSGEPRHWPPLLYVCWSAFLGRDPARSEGLVHTAVLLLEHGADPNSSWHNAADDTPESALYGACGVANHPAMTRLLLEAGADPNDGESLYHACEHFDTACLDLLYARDQEPETFSYYLKHVIDYRYAEGVRWFLSHGADPNQRHPVSGESALHWAVKRGFGADVIALLLDHGADPNARTDRGVSAYPAVRGWTAHDLALRLGQSEVAALLEQRGARPAPRGDEDELVVACAGGDGAGAAAILARQPHLAAQLGPEDAALMSQVAQMNNLAGVAVMAEVGFEVNAAGWMDATPLHWAACRGNPAMVQVLLEHGAEVESAAPSMSGTPLVTAVRQQWNPQGDFPAVVRLLLQAGAHLPEDLYPTGQAAIDELLIDPRREPCK